MTKKELLVLPVIMVVFGAIVVFRLVPSPISHVQAFMEDPFGVHRCSPELERRQRQAAKLTPNNPVPAQSIPVLVYHGIALESPRTDDIFFCNFKDHMVSLKEAGYQTITVQDFYLFTQGKKSLPDKSFLLTFDDGQRSSYYLADPILKKLNYSAVMFIITNHSLAEGSVYYLSLEEVKRMLKSGRWEIQSHAKDSHVSVVIDPEGGMGHYLSNKLWLFQEGRLETDEEYRARIRREFRDSKAEIEQTLGIDVIAFAFPFGDFGQGTLNLPAAESYIQQELEAVYELGTFYQVYPSRGYRFNYPDPGALMIKRISFETSEGGDALIENLGEGRSKVLPYEDQFDQNEGWITIWGVTAIEENNIQVQAWGDNNGSAVFLDGSFLWTDYMFKARVQSVMGNNVGLIARYVDKSNFVMCNYITNWVRLDQRLDDETITLVKQELETPLENTDMDIAVRVVGATASCLVDGRVVVEAPLDPTLTVGGIGLRSFDRDADSPGFVISDVRVEPLPAN